MIAFLPELRVAGRKSANKHGFRAGVEGLEGRALMAVGQVTISFASKGAGTPVKGDQVDGSIDLTQFDINLDSLGGISSATSGAGSGKATSFPFTITSHLGRQTPTLFADEVAGTHLTNAKISIRDNAARLIETYEFSNVTEMKQDIEAVSGGSLSETDTLTSTSVKITNFDPTTGLATGTGISGQVVSAASVSRTSAIVSAADAATAHPATNTILAISTPRTSHPTTTLTATVTAASGTPTGQVAFYNGGTLLSLADVGPDGKASLTVPGRIPHGKLFALYSGGTESDFLPSSSVSANKKSTFAAFDRILHRPMNAYEWSLTSFWLTSGITTPKKLAATYLSLSHKS